MTDTADIGCAHAHYTPHELLKAKHSGQYVEFEKALERGEEDKGKGKAVLQQISLL